MQQLNNKLTRRVLATALLAALSGGVMAQSFMEERKVETRIYGFLNGEIESVKAEGGATPYGSRGRVSDGNSRIGFAGSICIKGDVRGLWQIEGSLNNFDEGGITARANPPPSNRAIPLPESKASASAASSSVTTTPSTAAWSVRAAPWAATWA